MYSSLINPFSFEQNDKKFHLNLSQEQNERIHDNRSVIDPQGRLRNMKKQLQALAMKKEEMLFKESQMDYIFKKQKPSISISDFITDPSKNDKKFRVRNLLKQKKEPIYQFLNKKKQIYISNMNIKIKKQETIKLANQVRDEQQTLKAKKLYFENDVEFMRKFIEGIKIKEREAENAVNDEFKIQEILQSKIYGLDSEIQKIDNNINRQEKILNSLKLYKKFIDEQQDCDRNWKNYKPKVSEQVLFMTEGGAGINQNQSENIGFVIKCEPQNIIEVFADAQEANIREIQSLQDKQYQLEIICKIQKQQKKQNEEITLSQTQQFKALEKQYETKKEQNSRLKQLKKGHIDKVSIFDNEDLDVQRLKIKILQIYRQFKSKSSNRAIKKLPQSEIKKKMAQIQIDIQNMRQKIKVYQQKYSEFVQQIQSDMKRTMIRQKQQKNQQENRKQEEKKLQEQEKRRKQHQNEKNKGRKDMPKFLFDKQSKKVQKHKGKEIDHDQQYLQNPETL